MGSQELVSSIVSVSPQLAFRELQEGDCGDAYSGGWGTIDRVRQEKYSLYQILEREPNSVTKTDLKKLRNFASSRLMEDAVGKREALYMDLGAIEHVVVKPRLELGHFDIRNLKNEVNFDRRGSHFYVYNYFGNSLSWMKTNTSIKKLKQMALNHFEREVAGGTDRSNEILEKYLTGQLNNLVITKDGNVWSLKFETRLQKKEPPSHRVYLPRKMFLFYGWGAS